MSQGEPGGDAPAASDARVTLDLVLGERVRLRQPAHGYRAGLDAALLAAAVELGDGERGLEPGCGAGGALAQAAVRNPAARFTGLERDPAALAMAQETLSLNGLEPRVNVVQADVQSRFSSLRLPPFDAAFCNPPFFDDPAALRSPHPARRGAYIADGGLEAWTRFLLKAVREGGRIIVVHRADRLGDLLALLGSGAGSFRIRPVQPFADAPAKRVLVQAVKTGKAPLILLPALVLHDRSGGKHRPEVEDILRGKASLGWT